MPRATGVMQEAGFFEEAAQVGHVVGTELFAIRQRQLERRAFQVRQQDLQIVGVDAGVLGRLSEKIFRMLDDELVERRARCHQHRRRCALPPAGPPGALPRGGDRSWIPGHHHGVE